MQDWINTETENQVMGDIRLNKRLASLIDTLSVEPSKSIPCANDTWAETFAAYRFFDNDKVTFDSIMTGHKAATLDRIRKESVGMGGFLGRKGDGEPGVKTIWEGYDKLLHYIEAADAFGV